MKNAVFILAICSVLSFLLTSLIQISDRSRVTCEAKGGVELRTLDGTVCAKVELLK